VVFVGKFINRFSHFWEVGDTVDEDRRGHCYSGTSLHVVTQFTFI